MNIQMNEDSISFSDMKIYVGNSFTSCHALLIILLEQLYPLFMTNF